MNNYRELYNDIYENLQDLASGYRLRSIDEASYNEDLNRLIERCKDFFKSKEINKPQLNKLINLIQSYRVL